MTEIKNVEVYGLTNSIIKSKYPLSIGELDQLKVYNNDIDRAIKLSQCKQGTGHDNFLKGIIVQFDLKYPQYLSPQLQRYHWIDIVSSQSKMHTIHAVKLTYENCNKYVDENIMTIVNNLLITYNKEKNYESFMKVISNIPSGFELWMAISTNYLQLKTIFKQRKHHKLKEDWGQVINIIKTLPYSEFITGEKNENY